MTTKQLISYIIFTLLLIGLFLMAIDAIPRAYADPDKPITVPPCPDGYRDGLKP